MKIASRFLFLLAVVVLFSSHELFLKTDSHFLEPNTSGLLYLFNGTFDSSENEITRDRIVNAKILGPGYEFKPSENDYYGEENITYLKYSTGESGTYVAGISTLPRVLEMNAEDFNEYLEHEGLDNTIAERRASGIINKGAKERYSKHVKALLQVGENTSIDFMKPLGYPIEFVPLNNPFEITLGDRIAFKLLRDGKPLANHTVHYSTSVPGQDAHDGENSVKSNALGLVSIQPTSTGKWYVATIHMENKEGDVVDYESNWATLTFEIK
ncbi:DUF4198 domain-containing protein [Maribacter litopenaei]|uniref:DUF4198 domain-containing protein n=1 Tax=Maribacter litopenaei TaxID=2976127 RepID=A0ABY5YA49_9FLAO|nr:DUF4198 domain-containing protein [Maribacter litopenaei]UWX55928.1 DUF4198 domain-containing protein [Maribacter litopenaei]